MLLFMPQRFEINKKFVKSFIIWFLISIFIIDVWFGLASLQRKQKTQQKLNTLITAYSANKNNITVQLGILSQINNLSTFDSILRPQSSKADWWGFASSIPSTLGCDIVANDIASAYDDYDTYHDEGVINMNTFMSMGCPDILGWEY